MKNFKCSKLFKMRTFVNVHFQYGICIMHMHMHMQLLFFYGNDIFPVPLLSYVFPIKSHLVEKQILYISGVNRLSNTSNSWEF